MKMKKYSGLKGMMEMAKDLGLPPEYALISHLKTKIKIQIFNIIKKEGLTHQEVADMTGIPRSAITGIINGSLQRVSLDRLIRILVGLGKTVDFKIKDVA
jgi:predicted XRE-type DNA-binding protein